VSPVCGIFLWYDEDLEERDDLPNQLINHEAVYRTAPATPGLLKTLKESIASQSLV
jgi:hypothetical protein